MGLYTVLSGLLQTKTRLLYLREVFTNINILISIDLLKFNL